MVSQVYYCPVTYPSDVARQLFERVKAEQATVQKALDEGTLLGAEAIARLEALRANSLALFDTIIASVGPLPSEEELERTYQEQRARMVTMLTTNDQAATEYVGADPLDVALDAFEEAAASYSACRNREFDDGHAWDEEARLESARDEARAAIVALFPRWIPVEERMPEPSEDVLVYYSRDGVQVASWDGPEGDPDDPWHCDRATLADERGGGDMGRVTHWMPLPEPPWK